MRDDISNFISRDAHLTPQTRHVDPIRIRISANLTRLTSFIKHSLGSVPPVPDADAFHAMARDTCAADSDGPSSTARHSGILMKCSRLELLGLGLRRENASDWVDHIMG